MERKLTIVVDLNDPVLKSIVDSVPEAETFIQIFSAKTVLDIIGEAIEMHFNNELDDWNLYLETEKLLLGMVSDKIRITFVYVPYLQLNVHDDRHNQLLRMNMTMLVEKIFWQVEAYIRDFLLPSVNLSPTERLYVENVKSGGMDLKIDVKIVNASPVIIGVQHANPTVVDGFY